MSKERELVMVVKTEDLLYPFYLQQGFNQDPEALLKLEDRIRRVKIFHLMRKLVEPNATYQQPIPYIVIRRKGSKEIFLYRRTNPGDKRLANMMSIGVGGHMNVDDEGVFGKTIKRELQEELIFHNKRLTNDALEQSISRIGVLKDWGDSVGSVHVGLIYELQWEHSISIREKDKMEGEWVRLDERGARTKLLKSKRLEPWSRMILSSNYLRS